jgi:hypothetical protein
MDGEGCFYVKPIPSGFSTNVSISQHLRDEILLKEIACYLNCGIIEKPRTRSAAIFIVYKFEDICNKVIPFFTNYPLQGTKYLDFIDFCNIVFILKSKLKLTTEDKELIKSIKLGMNKNRYIL